MQRISKVLWFCDKVNEWVGNITSFLIAVLAFVVGYEVVLRYVFNKPTVWGHEMSSMIFGAIVMLGAGYTLLYKAHVSMDLIYSSLSVKKRAIIDMVTFTIFAFFCIVLLWKGGHTAWKSVLALEHSSTVWGPPRYPIKLLLPIGAFLLLLQGLVKFVRDAITAFSGVKT